MKGERVDVRTVTCLRLRAKIEDPNDLQSKRSVPARLPVVFYSTDSRILSLGG